MYQGKSRIKKKVGQKGFYGTISLEVDLKKDLQIDVLFENGLSLKWQSAIEAGIEYFYENEIRPKRAGLKITILEYDDMIIDSSFMVFFFLTYSALCEAFKIQNKIQIDLEGNFIIPK